MARNKIEDLRNALFEQLERLNDEDLTPEQLQKEAQRSKALINVSNAIVDTARLEIDFIKALDTTGTDTQFFKGVVKQIDQPFN